MDILNEIITWMNKENIRFYKLYASRISSSMPRKDIVLFDYIRKYAEQYKDEEIFNKLYDNKNKNAFYRLKNRLMEDLNLCLLTQNYYKHTILNLYYLLSLAKLYFISKNFKLSFRFLRKAEAEALRMEHYELLDIIYGEYISLSHEMVTINPEEYIRKRQENSKQLASLRQMDDIFAAVTYRVKTAQNFSPGENPILKMLQKTVNDFSKDPVISKMPKLRFKIYHSVSHILLQRRNYTAMEEYLQKTYTQFKKEGLFNKDTHENKLRMLADFVSALFKNGKIETSLQYAEEFRKAMTEFDNMLYDKYLFFYYNALVINYSILNKDKAIAILEDLKDNNALKNTPFYKIFVNLNLAILWFDKGEYHNAIRNLNKLYLHEHYKNADVTLKFKITIAELMIRYELQDAEFLEHRIKQVNKEFGKLFSKPEYAREKNFVVLIKKMIFTDNILKDKKLQSDINKFLSHKEDRPEDAEIIPYDSWMKKKFGIS